MSLNRKIAAQLRNRPKYQMSEEYLNNQAMARAAAFGRDRSIMQQEENLEQEAADAIGQAQQYSTSASGILSTLASISGSKNAALRNLAVDEATIQRGRMQDLYGANQAVAEEQDKEFEYNVNMPYQKKLEFLQARKRRREQLTDQIIGSVVGLGATALTGGMNQAAGQGAGLLGNVFSDERLKKNIEPTDYGLNQILNLKVMEYQYIHDDAMDNPPRHVGLMAQNVLEEIPEAVDQRDKYLKVNYNEIVPVLIKAVQEQNKIIELLKKEVADIKQPA